MNHEVEVSNLMFNKSSDEPIDFKKYDINVELEEESSNDQKTVLKYSIDLTSNPKNSVINISGNTVLSGEQSEIEEFLKQEDQKTPQVVSLIYQELFPLIYIISKNMKIPAPSHTISQDQIIEPSKQNNKTNVESPIQSESHNESLETNESKPEENSKTSEDVNKKQDEIDAIKQNESQ